jgi:AbrB family looped-hinge helix DNA binding protein
MGLSSLDSRGRVVIPKELRQKLGLRPDQAVMVEARGEEIVIRPILRAEEFIEELRGCVRGSKIELAELKQIWGTAHARH